MPHSARTPEDALSISIELGEDGTHHKQLLGKVMAILQH